MSGAFIRFLISISLRIGDIVNSDKTILRIYKAHPAMRREISLILGKLEALSSRAGVRTPIVYITDLPLPGSFVVGKDPEKTVLIFPKRLLNLMKPDQIEAMFAYNLVQINDSIRIRTLVVLVASLLTMSSSAVRWGAVFTGFGDYNDPAPGLFSMFVMGLVAPPAATIIHSVNIQDYDARAATLCESICAFDSAIECLENNNVTGYPSLGFVCLVDPLRETFFEELFRTHLSKELRIKNLTNKGNPE
jgi:hypothetical protein